MSVIVGDSCFVHAHLPATATPKSLDALNQATREWLLGKHHPGHMPPALEWSDHERPQLDLSPIWGRALSSPRDKPVPEAHCISLRRTLGRLGVARLVVGHTPQRSINAACDGLVWRCDTGMSKFVSCGPCEALEISACGAKVNVLCAPSLPSSSGDVDFDCYG